MATVSKARLRTQLELAFADVADLQAQAANMQRQALTAHQNIATVWELADLGEVPEYEVRSIAQRVS